MWQEPTLAEVEGRNPDRGSQDIIHWVHICSFIQPSFPTVHSRQARQWEVGSQGEHTAPTRSYRPLGSTKTNSESTEGEGYHGAGTGLQKGVLWELVSELSCVGW